MTVFEAYITNLGKYAEGQLVGETLKFPTTTEEVQSLLKNIGVDGVRYEEFFITAFDGDVMGLYDYLTEYENLDELNHLAYLISELDSDEIETLEAVLNKGDHTSSVADIINLVHNLDCYSLHPGVTDDETLGRIWGQHDFRIDHFFLASVVLGFLVILGKQLFSGLVGSSGNRRFTFASLCDFDIKMWYWQFV